LLLEEPEDEAADPAAEPHAAAGAEADALDESVAGAPVLEAVMPEDVVPEDVVVEAVAGDDAVPDGAVDVVAPAPADAVAGVVLQLLTELLVGIPSAAVLVELATDSCFLAAAGSVCAAFSRRPARVVAGA